MSHLIDLHPITGGARRKESEAAASAWGLLRNAFQEFSGPKFRGFDVNSQMPGSQNPSLPPAAADAFGTALGSGAWFVPRMLPKAHQAMHGIAGKRLTGQHWIISGESDIPQNTSLISHD